MHKSYPSKERWVQAWPALKKAQAEIKARSIWCQVVAQARRKSKKKDTSQQDDDTAEIFKTINKRLQERSIIFSEKVLKGEDEIFGDMVASELKDLSCSILKIKFKHEVNNLIFKYQILNLQQNA